MADADRRLRINGERLGKRHWPDRRHRCRDDAGGDQRCAPAVHVEAGGARCPCAREVADFVKPMGVRRTTEPWRHHCSRARAPRRNRMRISRIQGNVLGRTRSTAVTPMSGTVTAFTVAIELGRPSAQLRPAERCRASAGRSGWTACRRGEPDRAVVSPFRRIPARLGKRESASDGGHARSGHLALQHDPMPSALRDGAESMDAYGSIWMTV